MLTDLPTPIHISVSFYLTNRDKKNIVSTSQAMCNAYFGFGDLTIENFNHIKIASKYKRSIKRIVMSSFYTEPTIWVPFYPKVLELRSFPSIAIKPRKQVQTEEIHIYPHTYTVKDEEVLIIEILKFPRLRKVVSSLSFPIKDISGCSLSHLKKDRL